MAIFEAIAYVAITVTLISIGYSDLREREVNKEWRYIVMLICGLFTPISIFEKIVCLIVVPSLLMFAGTMLAKAKKKRGEDIEAIDVIGGADIKTLAALGFGVGLTPMMIAQIIAIPAAILFLFKPKLGISNKIKQKDPDREGIPMCTLIAGGYLLYLILQILF